MFVIIGLLVYIIYSLHEILVTVTVNDRQCRQKKPSLNIQWQSSRIPLKKPLQRHTAAVLVTVLVRHYIVTNMVCHKFLYYFFFLKRENTYSGGHGPSLNNNKKKNYSGSPMTTTNFFNKKSLQWRSKTTTRFIKQKTKKNRNPKSGGLL